MSCLALLSLLSLFSLVSFGCLNSRLLRADLEDIKIAVDPFRWSINLRNRTDHAAELVFKIESTC